MESCARDVTGASQTCTGSVGDYLHLPESNTPWHSVMHAVSTPILVTVPLVIAGDIEINPDLSASSSMGRLKKQLVYWNQKGDEGLTGGRNCTGMSSSDYLHPPESSTNWE